MPAPNALAQLLAAKDEPIVSGHHHLNVTGVDDHKKFWVDALGGVVTRIGTNNTEVIKSPDALLFLRVQKPSPGTKGSTLDHIAFSVRNLRQVVDRVKAGSFLVKDRDRGSLAAPPLPHHRTYGSVYGGSRSHANALRSRTVSRAI
jgi:hypothetical protein